MEMFVEATGAIADLLGALAWPGVALLVVHLYREQVGRLIDRLRKGGPAEFDPLPPPQPKHTESLSAGAARSTHAVAKLRTAAVVKWEQQLQSWPAVQDEADPTRRSEVLLTLAAKAVLVASFERTEAIIFASQLDLLNYLNARQDGEPADRLRELFYEPAVTRFPEIYRVYSFDNYLGFLHSAFLVEKEGAQVRLSVEGREYLLWRVEQRKPPRSHG